MQSIIRLKYEFSYDYRQGLEDINRILSVMPLDWLDDEEMHASIDTSWHMSEKGVREHVSEEVALTWGELVCCLHTGEGEGKVFRIDADVVNCTPDQVGKNYEQAWCDAHPDRELVSFHCTQYADRSYVLIIHCPKGA